MHSLGIIHWNSIRQDHPGNPGGVSGSGPVIQKSYDAFYSFLGFQEQSSLLVRGSVHVRK